MKTAYVSVVYSLWPPNAAVMATAVVREVVCTVLYHHFVSIETVRIHTGASLAALKVRLSYSGTLDDSCFFQAG